MDNILEDILQQLKDMSDPKAIEGMQRYGITPDRTYGVSIPNLRAIAKDTGHDHELAKSLWNSDIRETRILASMIDEPARVTEKQMEQWVLDLDYWEICDQCCMNLFQKSPHAIQKAVDWSYRREEFVKRAGFVLMARLAVADKAAPDELFESFLPIIEREATDSRNYVRKAVNWALRQIGKRNPHLNTRALRTAETINNMDSKSAHWIASDAIRELSSKKVQERLQRRKSHRT